MGYLRSGYGGLEGHLRTIWGPVWRVILRVISGVILGQFWTILRPYLGNLIKYLKTAFIWPWVGLPG